jgi:S1-C subfamily serine protease
MARKRPAREIGSMISEHEPPSARPPRRLRDLDRARLLGLFALFCVPVAILVAGVLLAVDDDPTPAAPAVAAVPPAGGFAAVVQSASPSVVQIRSARGLGSGIVYDTAGHVVTNAHVVAGSSRFQVTDSTGARHTATLRGTFPEGDLAVIDVSGKPLRPARFADSSRVRTGDYALAIGNPLGLRSSVTMGIVSATSRTVSEGGGVALPSVLQTSAPINPGNSGGALLNAGGSVIGIPTLDALDPELGGSAADGIGFAISSNTVRSIAPQLIKRGRVVASGRASLGVDLRSLLGGGTLVASVTPGGPAADAGIRAGDVLLKIGRAPATNTDAVALALANLHPGSTVPVEIEGGQGARSVQVKLG